MKKQSVGNFSGTSRNTKPVKKASKRAMAGALGMNFAGNGYNFMINFCKLLLLYAMS